MNEAEEKSVEKNRPCDLCSLPVGVAPFTLQTLEGAKYFCCDGCQGIYELLHEDKVLESKEQGEAG